MSVKTVALITGANQGIGFEIARKLATEHKDYQVIASGRRRDAVETAVATLHGEGLANVDGLVLDQTSDASIAAAVAEIDRRYGRLDVLVNNAATSGDWADSKPADAGGSAADRRANWGLVLETNVTSVALLTDACIPLMQRSVGTHDPKRIVFVSSTLGSVARKADRTSSTHANIARTYTTSKAALNMVALHYMTQFEDDANWKINCSCPGYCATNLNNYAGQDTPAQGAEAPAGLAVLGLDGPTGGYVNREGSIPW